MSGRSLASTLGTHTQHVPRQVHPGVEQPLPQHHQEGVLQDAVPGLLEGAERGRPGRGARAEEEDRGQARQAQAGLGRDSGVHQVSRLHEQCGQKYVKYCESFIYMLSVVDFM